MSEKYSSQKILLNNPFVYCIIIQLYSKFALFLYIDSFTFLLKRTRIALKWLCDEYFSPIKFCNGIVKKTLRGKIALNERTGFLQDFLSHKIAELIKEYLREKFFSEACLWKIIAADNLNDLQICHRPYSQANDIWRCKHSCIYSTSWNISPRLPQLRLQRCRRFVQHVSITHPSNCAKQIQRNWVSL